MGGKPRAKVTFRKDKASGLIIVYLDGKRNGAMDFLRAEYGETPSHSTWQFYDPSISDWVSTKARSKELSKAMAFVRERLLGKDST